MWHAYCWHKPSTTNADCWWRDCLYCHRGSSTPENLAPPSQIPYRDFGTPSVFLVSPNKQGIWHPHAKFPRLENLASPCKIPYRELGVCMQIFYSIQIIVTRITSVMAPLQVRIQQSLETFITVPLFAFCMVEIALDPHAWGGIYQSPHVSHSTISSYVSKHLTSAEQFNLHMELVTGRGQSQSARSS